jgi:hypothetical protein
MGFYVKGIVSQDFHICFLVSIDRSEVPAHKKRVRLLISFSCRIFDFLLLGVVSLPCEWSWANRLSAAILL